MAPINLNFMLKKAKVAGIAINQFDYPIDINSPISIRENPLDHPGKDFSRQRRQHDILHYSFFDEEGQEIQFEHVYDTPLERNKLVIEELSNESEWSEQILLQLTPELSRKFSDTQSIYDCLYKCET